MKRLRAGAGRAYTRLWHRGRPRSAQLVPHLSPRPLSTRFGLDRGRPVDRVYIERFLAAHATDLHGRGVEIYEPTYLERFGGARMERVDVLDADPASTRATIRGDFAALPADSFDCFVCTQTLQAIADPLTALRQAHAALRPGGVLLVTVPGISQIAPGDPFPDHVRYTSHGLRELAAQVFAQPEVRAHGNVAAAAAFLYGLAEAEVGAGLLGEAEDDPAYELLITLRAVRTAG
ncbi:MAG: class SAM-dependent methyltransferase [Solirubrobacterales bacterium]|nr:class SAM-dependent methyltransferase [Solirubrobacterales bacterium]